MWRLRLGALSGEGTPGGAEGRWERACLGVQAEETMQVAVGVAVTVTLGSVTGAYDRLLPGSMLPCEFGSKKPQEMVQQDDLWKCVVSVVLRNDGNVYKAIVGPAPMYLCEQCVHVLAVVDCLEILYRFL